MGGAKPRLLDQLRNKIRLCGYSIRAQIESGVGSMCFLPKNAHLIRDQAKFDDIILTKRRSNVP